MAKFPAKKESEASLPVTKAKDMPKPAKPVKKAIKTIKQHIPIETKPPIVAIVPEPIKRESVNLYGFTLCEPESIYTDIGQLTKKGAVWIFWQRQRLSLLQVLNEDIRKAIESVSLYTMTESKILEKALFTACIKAITAIETGKADKVSTRELINSIIKYVEQTKVMIINNLNKIAIY